MNPDPETARSFQSFFREVGAIFRRTSVVASYGGRHAVGAGFDASAGALMYDLAAIGIAVACFAFLYLILRVLDRV